MAESLLSVGLDVGTTTTSLVVSRLTLQNRATAFAIPELEITGRTLLYESPVHFTPLLGGELVDGEGLRRLVEREYAAAGIRRESVDTGAVIITGETSRRQNARVVLEALSHFAGEFVVATAGPELESELAARGAGAVAWSERTGKRVLHMDIGGGTANLALIEGGKLVRTACLNVGGRLIRLDEGGVITYVSPVLSGLTALRPGQRPEKQALERLAAQLTAVLEMAAGLRTPDESLYALTTAGTRPMTHMAGAVLSFSGGVADCIAKPTPWLAYGDLGPLLGSAIAASRLCRGEYRLGEQTIRATVIGAGCHSTQLSGSTVFVENVELPLRDLPVAEAGGLEEGQLRRALERSDQWGILALPGDICPAYDRLCQLAENIAGAVGDRPCYVALEQDLARALGVALRLRLPPGAPILCIDRVRLRGGSYLDVGRPVGPAVPVVIKTLVFSSAKQQEGDSL